MFVMKQDFTSQALEIIKIYIYQTLFLKAYFIFFSFYSNIRQRLSYISNLISYLL